MTTSTIERNLMWSHNGAKPVLQIVPLRLRFDRSESDRSSMWNYPQEYLNKMPLKEIIDESISSHVEFFQELIMNILEENNDAIISNGSVVAIGTEDRGYIFAKLLFYREESNINKLNSFNENFLIMPQELSELVRSSSHLLLEYKDLHISDHYMLNLLPNCHPPAKSVAAAMKNCCTFFYEGKDVILLHGDRGSGRTYFALAFAAKLRMIHYIPSFYLDCRQLQSSIVQMNQLLQEVTHSFHQCTRTNQSLLILDNFDALIPDIEKNSGDDGVKQNDNFTLSNQIKAITDHFLFLLNGSKQPSNQLSLMTVLTSENKIIDNDAFVSLHMENMAVPMLTDEERVELFKRFIQDDTEEMNVDLDQMDIDHLISVSKGYCPYDLNRIAFKIKKQLRSNLHSKISVKEEISVAFSQYIPSSRKSLKIVKTEPELTWSEVGGLSKAKLYLSESILQPIKYKKIYANIPVSIPKGILLYGPPGCGKTLIVPAVAKECGYNLVSCRGPELFDKYIGKSEAKVRELFNAAYEASPSILFFDDFDSLAPRRGSDNTGVTDRVVNQLLTYLDGVEVNDKSDVYIIAASSRPDKVDPALLRPGRLEKHIYLGFAESLDEWKNLFTKISLKRSLDKNLKQSILNQSIFHRLEELNFTLLGYSAADVKGIYDTAQLNAVHDHLKESTQNGKQDKTIIISEENLIKAFLSSKPSLPLSDRMMLAKAYCPFIGCDINDEKLKRGLGLDTRGEIRLPQLNHQLTALK